MKNSLAWRFATILGIVILAFVVVYKSWPLRLGIDLAGGTELLYEMDTAKLGPNDKPAEVAAHVIDVLRKRVDPLNQKNLIWRVVGEKRIQVEMPLADAGTRQARQEAQDAETALRVSSLKSSEVARAIRLTGDEREKAIVKLAAPGTERYELLKKLAEANDVFEPIDKKKAAYEAEHGVGSAPDSMYQDRKTAKDALDQAQQALDATNVDVNKLLSVLASADNPQNIDAQKELAKFDTDYPAQKTEIDRVIAAHKKLMEVSGGGVDDPQDLKHLITAAGVLDFRITVDHSELPTDAQNAATESLQQYGPQRPVTVAGTKARWFEIDPNGRNNFGERTYVTANWAGQPYVLCYDDQIHALTHERSQPWSVKARDPYGSEQGLVLPFELDTVGGRFMGDLTSGNMKRQMAILLDDMAMSAPTIQARITNSGQITFGQDRPADEVRKEALALKQIMDAGSLPATLQKEPISMVEITPDMGADNISAGFKSGVYALIAVVGFMMFYYTITGIFADLALSVNLLLVLAIMALIGGTFTLPGIAGLVLTLGMAVDANVLINERIREEFHKGASLWMAVKQGYDRVFWTIFDANLTTSLTSIVLIYVGSEEVKGFGVTLLIGLVIHMFTALFVTRTLMMGAIRVGIIRAIDDHSLAEYFREIFTFTWLRNGHWPFMRVITVSNIDWIGKRHIFWVISAVVTIAGMVAFVARGQDKYDIEFRGGTQITFTLKPGVERTRDQIEKTIKDLGHDSALLKEYPQLKDLDSARVIGVGKPSDHRFKMETTIANPSGDSTYIQKALLDPLAQRLKDVLDITPQVKVKYHNDQDKISYKQIDDLIDVKGIVRPITANTLDQVFAKTSITGIPNHDVSDQVGGVAIVLEDINPPQTARQLADRIRNARQEQSLSQIPYRDTHIIPVTADADGKLVPASDDDARPLTRAVMVSKDESLPYDPNSDVQWRTQVAATEWQVLTAALDRSSAFQGVTSFDSVVAGDAKIRALVAIVLSLILIVAYVWVRFGGIRYGLGAILSLVHDAVVALAGTVLAKYIADTWLGPHLLITDFKINLTMIAAYLTVIGYSVNDTIVIFDRVRELRGRAHQPLSSKLVNDAINQCFGRTIWTTFTVFIVVLIMYVWGGEGVRGFSFAMLIGVITGAYSTLAIASPMLLATGTANLPEPGNELARQNPFRQPEATK